MPEVRVPTVDDVAREVTRTAHQLRRLPESKLRRAAAGTTGPTVADAAHALAQWLADAAARVQPSGRPPVGHPVPRLTDFAVGDQVAVTGRELVDALEGVEPDGVVEAVCAETVERLVSLRRAW